MSSKRTFEDVEKDVKKSREAIGDLEDFQFDAYKFREEVDDDHGEYVNMFQEWFCLMQNYQGVTTIQEDVFSIGEHILGQGNLMIEDCLNDLTVKINDVNEKIEGYGAEIKQLREEKE